MADSDLSKLQNDLAQCFVMGGTTEIADPLTWDVTNVSHFYAMADCSVSFNNGQFDIPAVLPAGMVVAPPDDATTATFSAATDVCYMRKDKSKP